MSIGIDKMNNYLLIHLANFIISNILEDNLTIMETISASQFHAICTQPDIKIVQTICNKPKVLETKNNEILKLFHPRSKSFSSNLYKPYALRFRSNAKRLTALGFIAPHVTKVQYCPEIKTHIVSYNKLPGKTMDALITTGHPDQIQQVIAFIARLHDKGIFFRSLHLSNLLQQGDGSFAMIDITDIRFKNRRLPLHLRYRNLKHVLLHKEDVAFWKNIGIDTFLQYYFQFSHCSLLTRKIVSNLLKNIFNK